MFSLSSFRRLHPFRSFTSTRVSRAPPPEPEDLLELVNETQSQQPEELPRFSPTNIRRWDPKRIIPIKANKVIIPHAFTLNARFKPYKSRRKYSPLGFLGPPAAASRRLDPFYQLGINPLRECFNPNLLSGFVSHMGKIRSRAENNLTWRSQRRITRAIKRAKMMGIIPRFSKRPLPYGY